MPQLGLVNQNDLIFTYAEHIMIKKTSAVAKLGFRRRGLEVGGIIGFFAIAHVWLTYMAYIYGLSNFYYRDDWAPSQRL